MTTLELSARLQVPPKAGQVWRISRNQYEAVTADDMVRWLGDIGDAVPTWVHTFLDRVILYANRRTYGGKEPEQQISSFDFQFSLGWLGRTLGRSDRAMRRALREAERHDLVDTRSVPGRASILRFVPAKWLDFARQCAIKRRAIEVDDEAEIPLESQPREAGDVPRWLPPLRPQDDKAQVVELVNAVLEAILGEAPTARDCESWAHVVVRLWKHANRPPKDVLVREVGLVAEAARTCGDNEFREIRGLNNPSKRTRKHTRKRPVSERFRNDLSRKPSVICFLGNDPFHPAWDTRLEIARRHAAGTCGCTPHVPAAPADPEPPPADAAPDDQAVEPSAEPDFRALSTDEARRVIAELVDLDLAVELGRWLEPAEQQRVVDVCLAHLAELEPLTGRALIERMAHLAELAVGPPTPE
jgi:hypothetical protein